VTRSRWPVLIVPLGGWGLPPAFIALRIRTAQRHALKATIVHWAQGILTAPLTVAPTPLNKVHRSAVLATGEENLSLPQLAKARVTLVTIVWQEAPRLKASV